MHGSYGFKRRYAGGNEKSEFCAYFLCDLLDLAVPELLRLRAVDLALAKERALASCAAAAISFASSAFVTSSASFECATTNPLPQ